jgi:F0F1-type ATP synthase membrane subunit a
MLGNFIFAAVAAEEAVHSGHGHSMALGLHEWSLVWSSLIVIGIILASALMARGQTGLVPRGTAAVYEHMFDWLDGIAISFMGKQGRSYVPLAMSFFLFILISNWVGLLPWPVWHQGHGASLTEVAMFESPTVSISTTLALALLAVAAFNLLGLKKALFPPREHAHVHNHDHDHIHVGDDHDHHHHHAKGGLAGLWGWIAKLWEPAPAIYRDLSGPLKLIAVPLFFLFLLLNTMERFLPAVSLSLRLYGNIFAKHTVRGSLFEMMQSMLAQGDFFSWAIFLLLLASSCFVAILGALAGFLQAMIFTVLFISYIGHAVSDEH